MWWRNRKLPASGTQPRSGFSPPSVIQPGRAPGSLGGGFNSGTQGQLLRDLQGRGPAPLSSLLKALRLHCICQVPHLFSESRGVPCRYGSPRPCPVSLRSRDTREQDDRSWQRGQAMGAPSPSPKEPRGHGSQVVQPLHSHRKQGLPVPSHPSPTQETGEHGKQELQTPVTCF